MTVIAHKAKLNDRSPDEHLAGLGDLCPDCQNVRRLHAAMVEFGYEPLTISEVRHAYETALQRPVSMADGIITKMVASQLREAGAPMPAGEED